jgi:hypothetical protein
MSSSALTSSAATGASSDASTVRTSLSTATKPKSQVAATTYDAAILGDNVLAYYKLSDTTTMLHDFAPNPRDGNFGSAVKLQTSPLTSMNSPSATFPGGVYNTADFASVLTNSKLQPSIVSVEAWVDASALNTSGNPEVIVAYGRFSTGTPYQISVSAINQFSFSVHTVNSKPSIVATTTSVPGRIFHIVGTYDGANAKIYVNGVLQGQAAATGAITYAGIYSWSGLAIGSGFDALVAHPIENYAGTIADVSIYNYALTAAQVMTHYLAGVLTPPITETPASADGFVDSIGVNASFNYQGTVYDTQYNSVESLLVASGIRHIRTGMATGWPTYYTRLNQLGAAGIHSQLVTQGTETAAQIQAYPALVSQSIEAFEGPNEPELSGNANWLANTQSFMQTLYTAVKSNPSTATLPVVGPSVVTPADQIAIGNMSSSMDYGNIHPYFGTNNPGNTGTGSVTAYGRSGSLQYFLGMESLNSGTKPVIASETGFGTNTSISGNVSELCEGKEAPRTFFLNYMGGVKRTMPYQFVESGTAYGALGVFSYMGFLRQDLSAKPSYSAISALNSLLSDKGATFTTNPLTYTIGGNVNNLDHVLMEKRNGTYYLALWIEVPSWNPTTNTDVTAPAQSVTLALPATVTTGSIYTLSDTGVMTSASLTLSNGSVTIPVADRVTVVSFHP